MGALERIARVHFVDRVGFWQTNMHLYSLFIFYPYHKGAATTFLGEPRRIEQQIEQLEQSELIQPLNA